MSKNRKPSSQLRSRSGVARQHSRDAERRRGEAGRAKGGPTPAIAGEKRRASSSHKGACRWRRRAAGSRRRGQGEAVSTWTRPSWLLEAGGWTQERGSQGAGRGGRGRGAQSGGHASTTGNQDWGRSSCARREEPIVDWARRAGDERRWAVLWRPWVFDVGQKSGRKRPKPCCIDADRERETVRRQWRAPDWIRAKRQTAQQLGRFSRRGDAGELLVVLEQSRRLQGAGRSLLGSCGYLSSDPAAVGALPSTCNRPLNWPTCSSGAALPVPGPLKSS